MRISVSIIGLGLIGGSIAKALRKSNPSLEINGFDKEDVLKEALSEGSISSALSSIEEAVKGDIIFLCLPVDLTLKTISELAPLLKENQILTDVCGVKGILLDEWEKTGSKGTYFGGHPMTGKEKGGYSNSDPLLFENAVYILSENAANNDKADNLIKLIKSLGARITFIAPKLHDKMIAKVSHMPQLLSVSLVNAVTKNQNGTDCLDFAAGGFRDMTRIASSNFNIWEPVVKHNKEEILSALNSIKEEISEVTEMVEKESYPELSDRFESARMRRDEIPKNMKGFLHPLFDIYVFVKDEPGVISKISSKLFAENINIKDIELLKIREGTGGTFRLSFESEQDANRAEIVLKDIGFLMKE